MDVGHLQLRRYQNVNGALFKKHGNLAKSNTDVVDRKLIAHRITKALEGNGGNLDQKSQNGLRFLPYRAM